MLIRTDTGNELEILDGAGIYCKGNGTTADSYTEWDTIGDDVRAELERIMEEGNRLIKQAEGLLSPLS